MDRSGTTATAGVPSRLDSLTGLRFLAAFAVFCFHLEVFYYYISPISAMDRAFIQGPTGVSFFFILSGFVLTWSHRHDDTSGAFYQRRLAKISPLHVLTWGIMGLLMMSFLGLPAAGPSVASLFLFTPWIPNYSYHLVLNNPSWSLGCEVFFYALFPLLLPALRKLATTHRRWAIVGLVLLTFCFAAAATPDHPYTTSYWALYFFPSVRLVEFVLGMLLALDVSEGRLPRVSLIGASALALGAYAAVSWVPASMQPVATTVVPYSLLIVAAAQADVARRRTWLSSRAMVRLGTWSFALYMVHWPVLTVFSHFVHNHLGGWATVGVGMGSLVASVAASALLYKFVEHPLELLLRPRRMPVQEPAFQPVSPGAGCHI